MHKNKFFKAIILLGGSSKRFSEDSLKQCQLLSGKKVYLHTLELFLKIPVFDEIILVVNKKCQMIVNQDIEQIKGHSIKVVLGGSTRQESSFKGLIACGKKTDYVVIHDAVRPLVDDKIIYNNIEKVLSCSAIDTCIPTADTLVMVKDHEQIIDIPDRRLFQRGQTPQSFQYSLIMQAHHTAAAQGIVDSTDDCQLVLKMGVPVHYVVGDESNIKITTELDLVIAEQLLRLKVHNQVNDKDQPSLINKKFVVVGGTGGIGTAICELLVKEGAQAIALSRHSEQLLDISSPSQIEKTFCSLYRSHGEIDGLINSAGLLKIKELGHLTSDEIDEMLRVNLHGVIFSCKLAKIKQGGHIINIASSAYTRGRPQYSVYSCAKAAVVNFTQAFAQEHPQLNVNVVIPHRTKTQLRLTNFGPENEEELLSPYEVAKQIIGILKQADITGNIIEVRKNR